MRLEVQKSRGDIECARVRPTFDINPREGVVLVQAVWPSW